MNSGNDAQWQLPPEMNGIASTIQWSTTPQSSFSPNQISFYHNNMKSQNYSKKKRKGDNQVQPKSKKQRFHWDSSLHLHFLKQLFKYGLDIDIPVRKVFDTLRQYSNDITYEFVEKTLNSLRENLEETLKTFSLYYNQALHYQESYAGADTVIGKFSLYPFAPQSVNQLVEECQQLHSSQETKPDTELPNTNSNDFSNSLLPAGNYNRIAVPKSIFSDSFHIPDEIDIGSSNRETAMDSQIQLHQDMLFQNRYILNRNINQSSDRSIVSFGDVFRKPENEFVGITSSEDDAERIRKEKKTELRNDDDATGYHLSLITDVLSAQNDRFVEHVDRYLAEYPTSSQMLLNDNDPLLHNDDDSLHLLSFDPMYNNENDVLHFLK